jgi:hypothetical protein
MDKLPQTIGGQAPRCARLDLDIGKISNVTAEDFSAPKRFGRKKVENTQTVEVLFSGDQELLIRSNYQKTERPNDFIVGREEVYQLSTSDVSSIEWLKNCDDMDTGDFVGDW